MHQPLTTIIEMRSLSLHSFVSSKCLSQSVGLIFNYFISVGLIFNWNGQGVLKSPGLMLELLVPHLNRFSIDGWPVQLTS